MDQAAGAVSGGIAIERRLLQLIVLAAAGVAVATGAFGIVRGLRLFDLAGDVSADSHVRYFSGLLLGIGLAFWSAVPDIERHGARIRLLSAIVVCGGLARASALFTGGVPHGPALFALANETAVPVLVCLWQTRIARRAAAT
jgi:hypothetical protein